MKKIAVVLAALFCCSLLVHCKERSKVIMCYVMAWSVYRSDMGKFSMDDIDPHLCTHIIYSYSIINSTTWNMQSDDSWADYNIGNIRKLVGLKKENPELKVLSCIGGWREGSEKFSKMVENVETRSTFIRSVIKFLKKNKLDGLDIDWYLPTKFGGKSEDRENFVILLQELRKAFDPNKYILTVRLVGTRYAGEGYDLYDISESVDYINLKSYSYHGTWEPSIHVNSALQTSDEHNLLFSVNYFLQEGVDSKKLLLGLSAEGNAFILENTTHNKYIGEKLQGGFSGPWIKENGVLGFNEICYKLKIEGADWTQYWDDETSTPYAVNGNKFTSYDNQRSFQEKLKLIEEKNLGGASLFTLDKDDFKALCYENSFVLTRTIKSHLLSYDLSVAVINE